MNQSKQGVEEYCKLSRCSQETYFDTLLTMVDIQPGWSILDLGCGTGNETLKLAKAVGSTGSVVGIDPIKERIDKACIEHSLPNIEYRTCFGHEINTLFGDNKFDLVVSGTVMHWISPKLKSKTFESVYASLKTGGRFLFNCMQSVNDLSAARFLDFLEDKTIKTKIFESLFCPSKETFHDIASETGFTESNIEEVPVNIPYGTVDNAVKIMAAAIHVIDFEKLVAEFKRIVNDTDIDKSFLFDDQGEPRVQKVYNFVICVK